MPSDAITFGVTAFATLFSIVDPFAAAPIFLAMTPNDSDAARRRQARVAAGVCGGLLLVFALAGNRIFQFFGISASAFQVAGGILLLVIALDMLRGQASGTRRSPEEEREGTEKPDVSVTPLGIPLLAGPGAISTVTLLAGRATTMGHVYALAAAIALTSVLTWVLLANAGFLLKLLGQIGLKIVTRVMGLLLAGIGAQFILAGAKAFWTAA
ncbi:MAG: MarC family protein [Planctomycetales bacterium]|nr:MarC family protein [Planctomycetales bacterium]